MSGGPLPRHGDLEYVLPFKAGGLDDLDELGDYLRELARWVEVTVVDGSDPVAFAAHHDAWAPWVRHIRPESWPGANKKVAGVVTGVRAARHEHVIIADDDVRWDRGALEEAQRLLAGADLVRPQNIFDPLPWHARWDTARTLVNRCFGADYPGTFAVRRSTFLRMGGYDGDVLFENLELSRTLKAAGGREIHGSGLVVRRRPPPTAHFLRQRVRQAYDDFAQPGRLLAEAAVLPLLIGGIVGVARRPTRRWAPWALTAPVATVMLSAEVGRRRSGLAPHLPATSALWAPLWLLERAVCVWAAIGYRCRGGIGYSGGRLVRAAHSSRQLRRRSPAVPLAPLVTTSG